MKISKENSYEVYTLRYRIQEDENNPRFSTGKLLHIIQEICSGYSGEFTIRKLESGYVYEDGTFHEAEDMIINVSGVSQKEADDIAADLCAFLGIDKINVSKHISQYHTVENEPIM